MSDLDIKVIKEYLEDCAISDNFHYEQYQIELLLNAYDKKNKEIEIIEEDKKIEKIGLINYCETPTEAILHKKIDEIIDKINK